LDEQAKIPLDPEGFKQDLWEAIEAFRYDAYVTMCKDEGYDADDDPEDESESEDDLERSDFMPDYVVEGIALRGTQLICMSDLNNTHLRCDTLNFHVCIFVCSRAAVVVGLMHERPHAARVP
jgi:hypothetical protein